MNICICGLPKSGNRLVERLLQAHGVTTRIQHIPDTGSSVHERCPRAIIPVRRPDVWWQSINEYGFSFMKQYTVERDGIQKWEARRVAAIAERWTPQEILTIQYEYIVACPLKAGLLICKHAGVEYQGTWPEDIKDGNRKWLTKS